tara:strand:+ start:53 stop:304 length:252 start_codon:yes stop_codon:yes gene_type:complete
MNGSFSNIQNATHYLIEKRFELNYQKLKDINEFIVSMLDRILVCVDSVNKQIALLFNKINDITLDIMRLEKMGQKNGSDFKKD